jgi:hypothetical protein
MWNIIDSLFMPSIKKIYNLYHIKNIIEKGLKSKNDEIKIRTCLLLNCVPTHINFDVDIDVKNDKLCIISRTNIDDYTENIFTLTNLININNINIDHRIKLEEKYSQYFSYIELYTLSILF